MSSNETFCYAILTASDTGARGEREDISAEVIRSIADEHGFACISYKLVPDEQEIIAQCLINLCDQTPAIDLILTTGGTGFSMRDCTPEATISIADRMVPGIAEAMRLNGLKYTSRAMLSRAVSVIRKQTLIINLPGSPKAVQENLTYIIDDVKHGLAILKGSVQECARPFNENNKSL